jgi:plasmid stabilization system protein ParE
MELEIKWTKRASAGFEETFKYIEHEWGIKSAHRFIHKVNTLLNALKNQPEFGKIEVEEKGIRAFVFSRQNTIFYRVKGNKLVVLKIFDNRQDPDKKPK